MASVRILLPTLALALAVVLLPGRAGSEPPAPPAPPQRPAAQPRLVAPRTGPARQAALATYGGTAATEKAVAAGVDWLLRHQGETGLWDADGFPARCAEGGPACEGKGKGQHGEEVPCPFDEAISALAALALLGTGTLPGGEGAAGAGLERALARLATTRDGWATPLVAEALAEAEVLEAKGRWTAALHALCARLVAARQPDGAWGYAAPFRKGSDVPFTALVVPALLAARDAGVAPPTDLATRVDAWLGTLEEDEGRLAYLLDGRAYGYTPTRDNAHAAFALREWLDVGTQGARHGAHARLLAGHPPVWKISFRELDVPGRGRQRVQVGHLSLYAWWYGTSGSFQRGGAAWTRWFGALKSALLAKQVTTGCARGSWDPEGTYERQTGGRVFATALAVLMLESPYRHLRLADAGR
jgi:hypothetical protein